MKHNQQTKRNAPPKPATASQLYAMVLNLRRQGITASFGVQKDPKLIQR